MPRLLLLLLLVLSPDRDRALNDDDPEGSDEVKLKSAVEPAIEDKGMSAIEPTRRSPTGVPPRCCCCSCEGPLKRASDEAMHSRRRVAQACFSSGSDV